MYYLVDRLLFHIINELHNALQWLELIHAASSGDSSYVCTDAKRFKQKHTCSARQASQLLANLTGAYTYIYAVAHLNRL